MMDVSDSPVVPGVRLLAAQKNLVPDNRVAKCGVTVRQTPHVFSDSPGI